jgi:hypothetical protein
MRSPRLLERFDALGDFVRRRTTSRATRERVSALLDDHGVNQGNGRA